MNLKVFYCIVFLFCAIAGYGQSDTSGKNEVLYDPLFWKDKLKLDDLQVHKIRAINSHYYERLTAAARESNKNVVQAKVTQSLEQRSEEIWETFHPKQRRRWKKMWDGESHHTSLSFIPVDSATSSVGGN